MEGDGDGPLARPRALLLPVSSRHGANQFQLRHGAAKPAQRTFHFAQVPNFLAQLHRLAPYVFQSEIFILQFAMYVKNSIRRIFRSLRPQRSSRKKVRAKQISKQINVRSRTSVLNIFYLRSPPLFAARRWPSGLR